MPVVVGPNLHMVPLGVPWGYPGPFMVMLPGGFNSEVSQSGKPQPSASSKATATGTKHKREDGGESETDDNLDSGGTVHLLDED